MLNTRLNLDNAVQTVDYFKKIFGWLFDVVDRNKKPSDSLAKTYYNFLSTLSEKDKATAKNHLPALLFCLTLCEAHGIGCEQNIESAKRHFAELERLANDHQLQPFDFLYAKAELGCLLTLNIPSIFQRDYEKAAALLIESTPLIRSLKHLNRLRELEVLPAFACYKVGHILEKGCQSTNHKPDFELAMVFYKSGIEKSDNECAFALAKLYGEGKHVKKDLAKQAEYLTLSFKLAGNRALHGEVEILRDLLRSKKPDAAVIMALIEITHLQGLQELKEQYIELLKKHPQSREAHFALATMNLEGLFGTKIDVESAARDFYPCISPSSTLLDDLEKKALAHFIQIATTQHDLPSDIYLKAGDSLKLKVKPRNLELMLECYSRCKSAAGALESAFVSDEQKNLKETLKWLLKVGERDLNHSHYRVSAGEKLEKLSLQHPLKTGTRESIDITVASIRFFLTHNNFTRFYLERTKLRLNELSIFANSQHQNAAYAAFELAKVLEELPQNIFASPVDYYVQAIERSDDSLLKTAATHCLIELANKNSKAVVALDKVKPSEPFHSAIHDATAANLTRIMQELTSLSELPLRNIVEKLSELKFNDLTVPLPEGLLSDLTQILNDRENELKKLSREYLDRLASDLGNYIHMNKPGMVNRQEGVQELIKRIHESRSIKDLLELMNIIRQIEALLIKKNSENKKRTMEVKLFYSQQLSLVQAFLNKPMQTPIQPQPAQISADNDSMNASHSAAAMSDPEAMPLPPLSTTSSLSSTLASGIPIVLPTFDDYLLKAKQVNNDFRLLNALLQQQAQAIMALPIEITQPDPVPKDIIMNAMPLPSSLPVAASSVYGSVSLFPFPVAPTSEPYQSDAKEDASPHNAVRLK